MVPLTIDTFARRLRAGETSSAQVVEDCLRRIDADNPRLNAFILILAEDHGSVFGHDLLLPPRIPIYGS